MRQTIIGFDSAWAGNTPGGICALTVQTGKIADFFEPILVNFEEAVTFIECMNATSEYVLIALDQPTLVPNAEGIRPVERVAGTIVNGLGGGVQPANRSKSSMFGPDAPIWKFLDTIAARENPFAARNSTHGIFLLEVFPALALPSLIPEIWLRRRAAKYNPASNKFAPADWRLVVNGLMDLAITENLGPVSEALADLGKLNQPRKGDQDKLDAIISLLVGYLWRFGPPDRSLLIGDEIYGYMVTPVSPSIRERLEDSALKRNVPIDRAFAQDATREPAACLGPALTAGRTITLREPQVNTGTEKRQCPECDHIFLGQGWGGIDAHWKAQHLHIMSYESAWPIIRKGLKPSDEAPDLHA
jgi:predicted RNase H-like nuclease